MFVLSMKTTRPRVAAYVTVTAALVLTMVGIAGRQDVLRTRAAATGADDGRRTAYLQELGYEVEATPVSVREIVIPADSDGVFAAYNEIQTAAGYDLTPYCGERVKCWTYTVKNYPGEADVQAHLLVYNEKIIGGDIAAVKQDGFCHGLIRCPAEAGEKNGQTG